MSTSAIWITIAGLTAVTALIKGIGPALLGGRPLPPRLTGVIVLLPAALLAALVVSHTLADEKHLEVGAHTVGVAAAGGIYWRWRTIPVAVLAAALVTAALRAAGS